MGFNANKVKVQLKLAQSRLSLVRQKKAVLNQQAKREIALLLETGKEASARIRVETIIREDFIMEGLELLSLHVDTLLARFGILTQPDLDMGVRDSVIAILYGAPRVDIKELTGVREQLVMKYGKDFALGCFENHGNCVNERVYLFDLDVA